jgi:hypothetical protein
MIQGPHAICPLSTAPRTQAEHDGMLLAGTACIMIAWFHCSALWAALVMSAATVHGEPSPLQSMREAAEAAADIDPGGPGGIRGDAHGLQRQLRRQALREAARAEVRRELEPAQNKARVQPAASGGDTSHGLSAQARDSATQAQTAARGVAVSNGSGYDGGDPGKRPFPVPHQGTPQSGAIDGTSGTGGGRAH